MSESYRFHYLNGEGKVSVVVDIQCADDEDAKRTAVRFRPRFCTVTEIWTGERRVDRPDEANVQRLSMTRHPPHFERFG